MHLRRRALIGILNKKRALYPLVGILGIRQSGKSTILRDLIGDQEKLSYFTLDRPEILKTLRAQPESFLRTESNNFEKPIIIDEAQKAPPLFDVLKVLADEKRQRGMVLLAGSVDFAKAHGVREVLTGRIGISRLYPFTLGELRGDVSATGAVDLNQWDLTESLDLALKYRGSQVDKFNKEIKTYLDRGGMPTICRIGDKSERELVINDLLDALCYRDLMQLKGARYEGAIARELLSLIARHPTYSRADLAREMGEDARTIDKHIRGLEALFALHRVGSYSSGSRDDRFVVWDAAICRYLGGEEKTCLLSLMINQIKAEFEYRGASAPQLSFYASRGVTKIDLVVSPQIIGEAENDKGASSVPIVVSNTADVSPSIIKSIKALVERGHFSQVYVAAPILQGYSVNEVIKVIPHWSLGFPEL